MSEAVTFSEIPSVVELVSWRWGPCSAKFEAINKSKLWDTPSEIILFSYLYLEMHIFQTAIQKNIHEECIISEKNTVWKHPCYFVSKYKTSTNKLLQSSKKSFYLFLFFCVYFCFFFFSSFFKTGKIQSSKLSAIGNDSLLHQLILLKDPETCKPRSGGA